MNDTKKTKNILISTLSILIIALGFYGFKILIDKRINSNINTSDSSGNIVINDFNGPVKGTTSQEAIGQENKESKLSDIKINQEDLNQETNSWNQEKKQDESKKSQSWLDRLFGKEIKIKIIKKPRGEEPDWVKDAWIGLEIPVIDGEYEQKGGQEVLSKKFRASDNYVTHAEEALSILKKSNPEAEKWWRENVDLTGVDYIAFDRDECELINAD